MTEPTTIVFVDHAPALGGAEVSLLSLLAELDRRRYRPVLATAEGELAQAAAALNIEVRLLVLPRLRRATMAPLRLLTGSRQIAHVLRQENAKIVHSNTYRASIYVAVASAMARRPMVWHVRDMLRGSTARFLGWRARSTIAISNAVACGLPNRGSVRVIYNPVVAKEVPATSRSELGLPTDGPLVASIGRLRRWKGHGAFLEAASQVSNVDARFLVIGGRIFDDSEPDYGPELERLARSLGVGDRTLFLGQRDDLPAIMRHLSIVVHAADAEPFGRVVAEAQLSRLPVVAYEDGGVPEIVESDVTGLLVAPGNTAALAAGVDRLLADPAERDTMGAAARDRALRVFAPDVHARAVEDVYHDILAGITQPTGRAVHKSRSSP